MKIIKYFLELNLPIVEEDTKLDRIQILIDYFTDTRHNHDSYTFRFFFCELLNFVNVVGQIYFMDFFLGGEFTTYGSDVLAMSELPQEDRYDPMAAVFPKVIDNFISILIDFAPLAWPCPCYINTNCVGHKVHFQQVWSLWNCREKRWSLCTSSKHHQRENLRLPLVLVHVPCHCDGHLCKLTYSVDHKKKFHTSLDRVSKNACARNKEKNPFN